MKTVIALAPLILLQLVLLVVALETRPKTPSAALSSASARSRNRTYAPSPRRSSALHPELWAAFSSFDRPEGFSAGLLVDLYRRPKVAGGNKVVWLIVIVFVNTIGPIIYLIWGRRGESE